MVPVPDCQQAFSYRHASCFCSPALWFKQAKSFLLDPFFFFKGLCRNVFQDLFLASGPLWFALTDLVW